MGNVCSETNSCMRRCVIKKSCFLYSTLGRAAQDPFCVDTITSASVRIQPEVSEQKRLAGQEKGQQRVRELAANVFIQAHTQSANLHRKLNDLCSLMSLLRNISGIFQ